MPITPTRLSSSSLEYTSADDIDFDNDLIPIASAANSGKVAKTKAKWLRDAINGGVINVRDYGAVGGNASADTTAFQNAIAAVSAPGGVVLVPPSTSPYRLTANVFASKGTNRSLLVLLYGILEVDVQQIIPRETIVRGMSRGSATATYSRGLFGSTIKASNDFPNDGTFIVRLGEAGAFSFGSRLEYVQIDGGAESSLRGGVYSTSIQEMSGLTRVEITDCGRCILFEPEVGDAIYPTNYTVEDLYIRANRNPVIDQPVCYFRDVTSAPKTIRRITVTAQNVWGTAMPSAAYQVVGVGYHLDALYGEFCRKILVVGQSGYNTRRVVAKGIRGFSDKGSDISVSSIDTGTDVITTGSAHGLSVDARVKVWGTTLPGGVTNDTLYFVKSVPTTTTLTLSTTSGGSTLDLTSAGSGVFLTTADKLTHVVHIPSISSGSLDNIDLYDISRSDSGSTATLLIQDERAAPSGMNMWGADFNYCGHYQTLQHESALDSGASTRIVTDCTAWRTIRTFTAASGEQTVDPKSAGTLQVTANSDGTSAIIGISGHVYGRKLTILNRSAYNLTLKNEDASEGTSFRRLRCSTGSDIVLAQNEAADLEYTQVDVSASIVGRWYVSKR